MEKESTWRHRLSGRRVAYILFGIFSRVRHTLGGSQHDRDEPDDPQSFQEFLKQFRGFQDRKEGLQIQIHNEVMLWKSKIRRGFCYLESRKKVLDLLDQFRDVHDELDLILDRQKLCLEKELSRTPPQKTKRRRSFSDNDAKTKFIGTDSEECGEDDPDSNQPLNPGLMARLQSFKRVNEQHALILFRVIVDIEECKEFMNQ